MHSIGRLPRVFPSAAERGGCRRDSCSAGHAGAPCTTEAEARWALGLGSQARVSLRNGTESETDRY